MKKDKLKKYAILMAITGILLMMTGVGYALFTYFGLGNTAISISSNGVIFSYNEGKQGISLTESMPLTDIQGMAKSEYFEFNVKAKTEASEIPYYITARKTSNSSDIDEAIKLYLTKVDKNGNEEGVALVKFSDLKQYTNSGIDLSKYVEKLLYNTRVVSNQVNYHQTYRLRMWIDYDTDFTNTKYQNANFGLTINVYGTAKNSDIYAKANGRLHVTGSKLMNQNNEEFRITGASMSNNAIDEAHQYEYSIKSFSTLKGWGANGVRMWIDGLAAYNNAYHYIGNEEEYMTNLFTAIDNAIANDLYIVIVWDSQDPNDDPMIDNATQAFTTIANHYPNDPHILYEIWNEPNSSTGWSTIKEYANQIIPVIRNISPDSIIIVGTPNFNRRVDQVIGKELNFNNIMYAHHMYMNTLDDNNIGYLQSAIDAGVPIFETEWAGTVQEAGNEIASAHAIAFASLLNKYNISNNMFCFHATKWKYGFVESSTDWDENLPDSILKENAKLFKRLLKDDYSSDSYLMKGNVEDNGLYYRSSEWKDKIVSVEFKNRISVPANAIITWDLSVVGDNTVIGYLEPASEDDTYKLVICANGYVNLPSNSKNLFSGLTNVKSYDFTYAKTDLVYNLTSIFKDNQQVENLDLSNFNVSSLKYMYNMFMKDTNLKSVNLANWNNAVIEGVQNLFNGCQNLETVDLTMLNVSKTANFSGLFQQNYKLKTVDISTWEPTSVTSVGNMFYGCKVLETVNMSKFGITSTTDVTGALKNVKTGAKFIVKDQATIDLLTPTANNGAAFEISN